MKEILTNVGAGGGAAPAAAGAGGAAGASGDAPAAAAEEEKEEGMRPIPGPHNTNLTRRCREGRVRRGHGFRSFRLSAYIFPWNFYPSAKDQGVSAPTYGTLRLHSLDRTHENDISKTDDQPCIRDSRWTVRDELGMLRLMRTSRKASEMISTMSYLQANLLLS